MPETIKLMLGTEVACTDGVCGRVHALVVDPRARKVTHLVVEPKQRIGLGRLVALELVSEAGADVQLRCDVAAFDNLPHAEDTEFVPEAGAAYTFIRYPVLSRAEVHDVLPPEEVAEHAGEAVCATDGRLGVVAGLVVDAVDHAIVEVLVSEERSLFGHKLVAVAISAVASLDDGVQLNLATAEVEGPAS